MSGYFDQSARSIESRCVVKSKIINHLYHDDESPFINPPSNGMQKIIIDCESYAEVYGGNSVES